MSAKCLYQIDLLPNQTVIIDHGNKINHLEEVKPICYLFIFESGVKVRACFECVLVDFENCTKIQYVYTLSVSNLICRLSTHD